MDVAPVGKKAAAVADALATRNIKAKVCTETTLRMVTHNDIQDTDIQTVLQAITEIVNT